MTISVINYTKWYGVDYLKNCKFVGRNNKKFLKHRYRVSAVYIDYNSSLNVAILTRHLGIYENILILKITRDQDIFVIGEPVKNVVPI